MNAKKLMIEEFIGEVVILNNKKYFLEEIYKNINDETINPYSSFPEYFDIELLRKLDLLKVFPQKKSRLWMLTDAIIQAKIHEDNKHNCYWNDLFYLTNRFDSDDSDKKRAAIVALWNGRHNYWEWKTHHGFNNRSVVFAEMKMKEGDSNYFSEGVYTSLSRGLHNEIQGYFGLTNDDLRAAKWICSSVYDKEKDFFEGNKSHHHLKTDVFISL